MAALVIVLATAQAACPSLDDRLSMAETALQDVHLDATRAELGKAQQALSCGKPASPEQIARMWLLEGIAAVVENDPTTAGDALQAVARIAPRVFDDAYGPRLQAAWQEAREAVPGRANLLIDPVPPGFQRWIDGAAVNADAPVTSGLHVIQVSDPTGTVRFGDVLFLEAGQRDTLQTGLAPITLPAPPPLPEKKGIRAPGWAVVAGVAIAAGLGTGVYATTQNQRYKQAAGYDELDQTRARQVGAATATYGFGGVAAAAGALFLARQF